jgi:hypothetical protein
MNIIKNKLTEVATASQKSSPLGRDSDMADDTRRKTKPIISGDRVFNTFIHVLLYSALPR